MLNINFEQQSVECTKVWRAKDVLPTQFAKELEKEFDESGAKSFKPYDNRLEKKLLMDDWSKFGEKTYKFVYELCSAPFVKQLEKKLGVRNIFPDFGLHGAGLFLQNSGWHLNPHIDYKVHPKLGYERKLSLLLYLTSDWKQEYCGDLRFYANDSGKPAYDNSVTITPEFNSMVIFECTDSSWHGVDKISCPVDVSRKAIGLFYLQDNGSTNGRSKATYAPQKDQLDDPEIQELIKIREKKRLG